MKFRLKIATLGSLAIISLTYLFCAYLLPIPKAIDFSTTHTTKIYDRNGVLLYEILQEDRGKKSLVHYDQLPPQLINAFLAAEDKDFFSHGGINYLSTLRALYQNVSQQRIVSGGSTLTQQLARNVLGNQHERTLLNKVIESAYALRFEHVYTKESILEQYLNTIYFGNLSYGIESAARDYFGTHTQDLDLAQIALLAGLPQAPSFYNPFINLDAAKKRQQYVLNQMVALGVISQNEADEAYEEKLVFRPNIHDIKAPHFVQFIINDLEQRFGPEQVYSGGLSVYTTLDYYTQEQIHYFIDTQLADLEDKHVSNAAVLVVDLTTNSIVNWIGSAYYFDESIDGAVDMTHALRQPGSALKPFTYLLALMKGKTLASTISDVHTQFNTDSGPYTPRNYDLQYHGMVRAREALASSFNIPAVKMLDFVGVNEFISFLHTLGLQTIDAGAAHYGLSLTLGGAEVRMIDLTQAYSILAQGGMSYPLSYYSRITDSQGAVLYSQPDVLVGTQVLGSHGTEYAALITDALSDPTARYPGFGEGSYLELSFPAAVKTGTTRNFRDNWTFGYSPRLLTAVWVGNADASPMENVSGVDGAGPIWNATMEYLHEHLQKNNFSLPETLIERDICRVSGMLPTDYCPDIIREKFIAGTEPTQHDTVYQNIAIDSRDGSLWRDGCPERYKKEQIFQVFPAELHEWALEHSILLPPKKVCKEANSLKKEIQLSFQPTISNPQPHDSYKLESTIPNSSQRIPFRITTPYTVDSVCWYVDNKLIECVADAPYSARWVPIRGIHTLVAEVIVGDSHTKTDTVSFEIQ